VRRDGYQQGHLDGGEDRPRRQRRLAEDPQPVGVVVERLRTLEYVQVPIMCAIRNSSMRMPLTAITNFLKTELVFATFGVLRWPDSVTVTTGSKLDRAGRGGHVNTA
jgi:hypothetical protein